MNRSDRLLPSTASPGHIAGYCVGDSQRAFARWRHGPLTDVRAPAIAVRAPRKPQPPPSRASARSLGLNTTSTLYPRKNANATSQSANCRLLIQITLGRRAQDRAGRTILGANMPNTYPRAVQKRDHYPELVEPADAGRAASSSVSLADHDVPRDDVRQTPRPLAPSTSCGGSSESRPRPASVTHCAAPRVPERSGRC